MRIAQYAQRFQDKVTLWQPARKEIVRLKNLISLRERLVRVKKSLATPLGELIEANSDAKNYIEKLTRPVIEKMSSQIIKVEHQINQLIKDDKHLNRLEENKHTSTGGRSPRRLPTRLQPVQNPANGGAHGEFLGEGQLHLVGR